MMLAGAQARLVAHKPCIFWLTSTMRYDDTTISKFSAEPYPHTARHRHCKAQGLFCEQYNHGSRSILRSGVNMPSGHFVGYFRYGTDLLWNSIRLYKTPHTQMNSIVRTHGLRGLPEWNAAAGARGGRRQDDRVPDVQGELQGDAGPGELAAEELLSVRLRLDYMTL